MMSVDKKTRQIVYNKYRGHCAYCGKELEYKDMQVDHLIPQMKEKHHWEKAEVVESIGNLMPSCRRCNHYKRAHSLKTFRKLIETIPDRLSENYIFKVANDYNLMDISKHKVVFYFEQCEEHKE